MSNAVNAVPKCLKTVHYFLKVLPQWELPHTKNIQ